jgi:hypothetical protein
MRSKRGGESGAQLSFTSNSAAPTMNQGVVFVHSLYPSILKYIMDACNMAQLDYLTLKLLPTKPSTDIYTQARDVPKQHCCWNVLITKARIQVII